MFAIYPGGNMAHKLALSNKLKIFFLTIALAAFSTWALMSTAQTRRAPSINAVPSTTNLRTVFVNGESVGTVADLRALATRITQVVADRDQKAVFLQTDATLPIAKFQELGWSIQEAGGEVYVRKTQAVKPSSASQSDPLILLVSTDGADKILVQSILGSPLPDNLKNSVRLTFLAVPLSRVPLKVSRLEGSFEIDATGTYFVNEGPGRNLANANVLAFNSSQRPVVRGSLAEGFKAIMEQHRKVLQATEEELKNEDPSFVESVLKSARTSANEINIIVPPNASVAMLFPIFDAAHDLDVSFKIVMKPAGQ